MFTSSRSADNFSKIKPLQLNKFFYSDFFPLLIGILAIISYSFNLTLIGFWAVIIFAIIIFLTSEDVTPILPLLIMVLTFFRTFDIFLEFDILIPCALVLIAIILHFILFPIKKIESGKLFLPLIIVTIALFLGGVFSHYLYTYKMGVVSRIATGPVMIIVYFFFTAYLNPPKNFDMKRYISVCLVVVGFVCTAHLAIYNDLMAIKDPSVSAHTIGWNNANGIASLLLLCIPACFYLILNDKSVVLYTFSLIILYIGLSISNSDGCFAIGIVCFPILCLFTYIKANKTMRPKLIYTLLVVILLLVVGLTIWLTQASIYTILEDIKKQFVSDSGRTELYIEAINHFIKYPIFGIGFGYTPEETKMFTSVIIAYNYHSTFFHVIATMGIVGLLAYIYYFVKRYKILLNNDSAFNTFSYISFSAMEVYGFIDCCEFNIMPLLIIATLLLIVVEKNNLKKEQALPLTATL